MTIDWFSLSSSSLSVSLLWRQLPPAACIERRERSDFRLPAAAAVTLAIYRRLLRSSLSPRFAFSRLSSPLFDIITGITISCRSFTIAIFAAITVTIIAASPPSSVSRRRLPSPAPPHRIELPHLPLFIIFIFHRQRQRRVSSFISSLSRRYRCHARQRRWTSRHGARRRAITPLPLHYYYLRHYWCHYLFWLSLPTISPIFITRAFSKIILPLLVDYAFIDLSPLRHFIIIIIIIITHSFIFIYFSFFIIQIFAVTVFIFHFRRCRSSPYHDYRHYATSSI